MRTIEVAVIPGLSGPSTHPVGELTGELVDAGLPTASPGRLGPGTAVPGRAAERLGLNRRLRPADGRPAVLVPLMGPQPHWLFPYSLQREVVLLCWDVWPPDADDWARLFRRHRVRHALMTARTSARRWTAAVPALRTAWLPEAITPFAPATPLRPLADRSLDVLELGRRHARYHALVTPALHGAGHVHRYEPRPGRLVFDDRAAMLAGLLDTRVSVCFPSSTTHPERSGDVETLTRRYLESMAAGCLVVGAAPAELRDLFGYDPVVPVDWRDPVGQLLRLLRDPSPYQPLVDRNAATVHRVGTWRCRVPALLDQLADWGFARPGPAPVTEGVRP